MSDLWEIGDTLSKGIVSWINSDINHIAASP